MSETFNQETYDKFHQLVQGLFNIKTDLHKLLKDLRSPRYNRPEKETLNKYKETCSVWYESFDDAIKEVTDKKPIDWLVHAIDEFKNDIIQLESYC